MNRLRWLFLLILAILPILPVPAIAGNANGIAVIIGNRSYRETPLVGMIPYARRDADAIERYVRDILGYGTVLRIDDASQAKLEAMFGNQRKAEGELHRRVKRTGQDAEVVVYYSGHGMRAQEGDKPASFLLPVDVHAADAEINGYPLDMLYRHLGGLGAQRVLVMLEACFSGQSGGGPLIEHSAIAIVPIISAEVPAGVTVLSAAKANQTAYWDRTNQHGFFTEYLLRGLYGAAGHAGQVSLLDLHHYLERQVPGAVEDAGYRGQTPSLQSRTPEAITLPVGTARPDLPFADERDFRFVEEPERPGPRQGRIERVTPDTPPPAGRDEAANLIIDSSPQGARVVINGVEAGTTPFQKKLKPGIEVDVLVEKENFHPRTLRIPLRPGLNTIPTVTLGPAAGTLSVNSEPAGADVLLGGRLVGTTPYLGRGTASGRYLLTVRKHFHRPVEDTIEIIDGSTVRRSFTLEPEFGTLVIGSDLMGTRLQLRDDKGNLAEAGIAPETWRLRPGSYRLEMSRDGRAPATFALVIARGETRRLIADEAQLRRLEGTLSYITTAPLQLGAEILIDGNRAGTVPMRDVRLQAGQHTITVKTASGTSETTITLGDGETLPVEVRIRSDVVTPDSPQPRPTATLRQCSADMSSGTVCRDCPDCPEMVIIPAGRFQLWKPTGSTALGVDPVRIWKPVATTELLVSHPFLFEESFLPIKEIQIDYRLAVGRFELTKGEWRRFADSTGWKGKGCYLQNDPKITNAEVVLQPGLDWDSLPFSQGDAYPVSCVSWNDTKEYIDWLNGMTGNRYRLLSESEWTYIMLAGEKTVGLVRGISLRDTSPGNTACTHANLVEGRQAYSSSFNPKPSCGDGYRSTAPVGRFKPNAFGVHDTIGNVSEWVEDCHADLLDAPGDGRPQTCAFSNDHAHLGASFMGDSHTCRGANCYWFAEDSRRDSTVGFRIVRRVD